MKCSAILKQFIRHNGNEIFAQTDMNIMGRTEVLASFLIGTTL
jgi:hypothetical protein